MYNIRIRIIIHMNDVLQCNETDVLLLLPLLVGEQSVQKPFAWFVSNNFVWFFAVVQAHFFNFVRDPLVLTLWFASFFFFLIKYIKSVSWELTNISHILCVCSTSTFSVCVCFFFIIILNLQCEEHHVQYGSATLPYDLPRSMKNILYRNGHHRQRKWTIFDFSITSFLSSSAFRFFCSVFFCSYL